MKRTTLARLSAVAVAGLLTLGGLATAASAAPAAGPESTGPTAPTPTSPTPNPPTRTPTATPTTAAPTPTDPSTGEPSVEPTPTWDPSAEPTPPDPSPTLPGGGGTVRGTFTTDAGAPIAGGSITVWSAEDLNYLGDGSTDENGAYTITGLPTGDVKLSFQQDSVIQYAPRKRDYTDAGTYPIAGGGTLTVDERQLPVGTIRGRLTSSQAIDWLTVNAEPTDGAPNAYAYADGTGTYEMKVLAGDYRVNFSYGSSVQWAYHTTDRGRAAVFSVAAGQTVVVDDTLMATGTLSGTLTSADGGPVPDWTQVTLYRDDEYVSSAVTQDGRYTFDQVLAGDYQISFAVGDGVQWIKGARSSATATTFTVTAGETTVADDTALAPSTVSGRLVDSTGAALAGYHVQVGSTGTDDWTHFEADTDADGRWQVSGPLDGRYKISFSTPDYNRVQWAHGKASESDADSITVTTGAAVTVDETWLPGATLVVHAVDSKSGRPVKNVCAYVYAGNGVSSCSDGSDITVTDLPPGALEFDVSPQSEDTFYLYSGTHPATLTSAQTTTVTVGLVQGGKVTTTATDSASGAAVADACVALRVLGTGGIGGGVGDCSAGPTGTLTTGAVAPGTYEMFVDPEMPYGRQWVGAAGGTGDQRAAKRIVVKAGKVTTGPAVKLDRAGTIGGTVYGPDGKPAQSGISLDAWDWGLGPDWATGTDEKGHYSFDRFGPYAWPLAFTPDGAPRQWSGAVGNRNQADLITVQPGQTTTYDMHLLAGTTVHGTATTSKPFTWFRLTAVNAATGDPMGVADCYDGCTGGFSMPIVAGQKVTFRYDLGYQDGTNAYGDYRAPGDSAPTVLKVPKKGLTFNPKIG